MDEETSENFAINFSNLRYSVNVRGWKTGMCRGQEKVILNGVSGCFKSGQLAVIMGASGTGKTSLLNILAGAVKSGFSGDISVIKNGKVSRSINSVYILQDCVLASALTVNEAMNFAFYFQCGIIKSTDCQEIIDGILEALNLGDGKFVMCSELSGGEKKRLTIALEMIRNPTVMYFDEPTSGLDYSTSIQCMKVLKKLAKDGRVVVATVHQPAPLILHECDQLYILAAGQCIYTGQYDGIVEHLRHSHGIVCPQTYNPAEFLLEIASDAYDNDWKSRLLATQVPALPEASAPKINLRCQSHISSGFLHQLVGLVKRRSLITYRDISLIGMRSVVHILCIIIVCIMYWDVGREAENVLNNLRYVLYTFSYFSFVSHSASFSVIPREIPIVKREHFNGWYSILPYYLSLAIVDLPLHVIAATLYSFVTYWVTSQPMELQRVIIFTIACIALVVTAYCIGFTTGFIFNVQNASILGQVYMVAFYVACGSFITQRDAPSYLHWLFDVSFIRHGHNTLFVALYGLNRTKLPCNEIYCHHANPRKILHTIDVDDSNGWSDILKLLYLLLFFLVLGYFVARRRILNVTRK
ncbi:ATP-binding cassette sub-family G member 4-like [Lutzomyia longipalpis]|uniref:ATP-binding cassette sub-family G member 4-like n=1 Tax=Lutzomyia longipalpis TaxID=7200 RepID=UPI00248472BB|nr:ATP-binding cassette sub-family G member 4-like [Lutzomyia longipalpis]